MEMDDFSSEFGLHEEEGEQSAEQVELEGFVRRNTSIVEVKNTSIVEMKKTCKKLE